MNSRLRSFLLPLALLTATAAALAHSATEPAPRNDDWWKQRHAGFNTNVAALGARSQVVFLGDSITQGWEGEGKAVWARYYAHRHALNLGIGGDRTQHVLWRLDHGNLDGLAPKATVVMIGTNNSNGEDNTPEQIIEGVRAIVAKLRTKLPGTKVLLLAIFPRSENFSVIRGKLAQLNQALRRVADGKDIVWVDFGDRFLNDDGTMPKELMPDYLHLSPAGYVIWAEAIEDRLSQLLGDARVKPGAAAAPGAFSGEWVFTIPGPDGQPVSSALILQQDGVKVTGKFQRAEGDRWLTIENGKVNGSEFSWTVKRDRPDGTSMTYEMSGKLADGAITGKAKAQLDGNELTSDWSAKRK